MERIKGNKKKTADFILVISLLAVSLILIFVFWIFGSAGDSVKVEIDGKTVGVYSLLVDGEYALNGGTNTLVIEGGKAYISYANCPDKLCEKHGKISRIGERIVCLPNKIIITVEGKQNEDFIPMQ